MRSPISAAGRSSGVGRSQNPAMRVLRGVALAQQNAAPVAHHQQGAAQPYGNGLPQFHGQLRRRALLPRPAAAGQRTDQAERIARQTDRGAQFHQRLVEVARFARVQPLLRDLAKAFARAACRDIGRIVVDACHHAQHVAVQHRKRQVERDAADRRRSVVADARQRPYALIVPREAAGRHDLLRRRAADYARASSSPSPLHTASTSSSPAAASAATVGKRVRESAGSTESPPGRASAAA